MRHSNLALGRRATFVALALGTIAVGLAVHLGGGASRDGWARDFAGDALWAMMIAWFVAALAPHLSLLRRGAIAYAICAAVEFSQLYHAQGIDAARATLPGRLVLGSGFDPRDLLAYGVGVLLALLLERGVRKR